MALLAVLLAGTAIAPATAAATDGGVVLATHVLSSVAADLDGDGSKEIVAVVADAEEPATLRVGVWGVRSGSWVSLGQDVVEAWQASEATWRTAQLSDVTVALLVVRAGDERRVIVAMGSPYDDGMTPGACCLSFGAVRLIGGVPSFEPIPGDFGSAESINVVDLEADGHEQLLVSMSIPSDTGPWTTTYTLLRQAGDRFAAEPVDVPDDEIAYFNTAADVDGLPGDELYFTTDSGEWLLRATSANGDIRLERSETEDVFDAQLGGWIVGAGDDVMVLASDRNIVAARWPTGGKLAATASLTADRYPTVYLVGSGADARVVDMIGMDDPAVGLGIRVYDLDLNLELAMDSPPPALKLWQTIRSIQSSRSDLGDIWPAVGVIPGGLPDGRPGFLGGGQLVGLTSAGPPEVREAAQLVGGAVMGFVGPDSAWLAHGMGWYGPDRSAYLGATGVDAEGLAASLVTVVPVESVVDIAGVDDIDVVFDGAVLIDSPDGPRLFAGGDGFRATIAGDPGMRVVSTVGSSTDAKVIGSEPLTLAIDPGGRRDRNGRQVIGLVVISAAGLARMIEWDLTTLHVPPEVTAESWFDLFGAHATVAGSVDLGTTVIVDGRAVETAADGSYRVDVDASPWPHDIAVVARDPLGVEAVRHIEVVGFVDVRALPWVPIIIALTLAAGVVLFIRTPSLRPGDRLLPDGDGRLEELDGDGI